MTRELMETAAYWSALAKFPERSICVWRSIDGKPAIMRLFDQRSYAEWSGCFSLVNL
jgi:hypothetical protein